MALLKSLLLEPGVQTDLTGGGLGASEGGTFMLNLCNDSGTEADVGAILVTGPGEEPEERHKMQPQQTIEPYGWRSILPLKLGPGFKVFVTSSIAISAQLNAQAD